MKNRVTSTKKWKKACKKALAGNPLNPILFVRVEGKDKNLSKRDPGRIGFSPNIQVDVIF